MPLGRLHRWMSACAVPPESAVSFFCAGQRRQRASLVTCFTAELCNIFPARPSGAFGCRSRVGLMPCILLGPRGGSPAAALTRFLRRGGLFAETAVVGVKVPLTWDERLRTVTAPVLLEMGDPELTTLGVIDPDHLGDRQRSSPSNPVECRIVRPLYRHPQSHLSSAPPQLWPDHGRARRLPGRCQATTKLQVPVRAGPGATAQP